MKRKVSDGQEGMVQMVFANLDMESEIEEFTHIMLLKEDNDGDRSWKYHLERFIHFLKEIGGENGTFFNEDQINRYIDELQSKEKDSLYIKEVLDGIVAFSQYKRIPLDKEKLKIPVTNENEKFLLIDEEEDLYRTEKELFNKLMELSSQLSLHEVPPLSALSKTGSYIQFRNIFKEYVLFRIVVETGLDETELHEMNLESFYKMNGEIIINQKKVPLTPNTNHVCSAYVSFREKFDETIFIQKKLFDVDTTGISLDELLEEEQMMTFFECDLTSKVEKIESLLLEQVNIEEEIALLEEDTEEEKIEDLEEKADDIAEQIMNMKMLVALDRKISEYEFNNGMFVTDRYTRMTENDILEALERTSFPIHKLQNTAIKKWTEAGIKRNQIEKLIRNKSVGLFSRNKLEVNVDEFKQLVHAGFQFETRDFTFPTKSH
ncbi:hypothetical protein QA612_06720 [Evansella sp. AB-P1]|uniref:hypothetical protein n=1 Tax=Evansella sp. AB-P1 TaxID=3037653 RepID=UPI00241DAA76|nr:hypothetical protein [Evansella sp. AB-P1]MDG5787180.1 hypothetical protein [Evansella sp. AB-P1]